VSIRVRDYMDDYNMTCYKYVVGIDIWRISDNKINLAIYARLLRFLKKEGGATCKAAPRNSLGKGTVLNLKDCQ
jgi:hypothetical protein